MMDRYIYACPSSFCPYAVTFNFGTAIIDQRARWQIPAGGKVKKLTFYNDLSAILKQKRLDKQMVSVHDHHRIGTNEQNERLPGSLVILHQAVKLN